MDYKIFYMDWKFQVDDIRQAKLIKNEIHSGSNISITFIYLMRILVNMTPAALTDSSNLTISTSA